MGPEQAEHKHSEAKVGRHRRRICEHLGRRLPCSLSLFPSLPFPSDDERGRLRAAWCEGDEERGPRRRGLRGIGGGEGYGALVAAKWAGLRGLVEGEVGERAGASGAGMREDGG